MTSVSNSSSASKSPGLTNYECEQIIHTITERDVGTFNSFDDRMKSAAFNSALQRINQCPSEAGPLVTFLKHTGYSATFRDKVIKLFERNSPASPKLAERIENCLKHLTGRRNYIKLNLEQALEAYNKQRSTQELSNLSAPQCLDNSTNSYKASAADSASLLRVEAQSSNETVSRLVDEPPSHETLSAAKSSAIFSPPGRKSHPLKQPILPLFAVSINPDSQLDFKQFDALRESYTTAFCKWPMTYILPQQSVQLKTQEALDAWNELNRDWMPEINNEYTDKISDAGLTNSQNQAGKSPEDYLITETIRTHAERAQKALDQVTDPDDYKMLFLLMAASRKYANTLKAALGEARIDNKTYITSCARWEDENQRNERLLTFRGPMFKKCCSDPEFIFRAHTWSYISNTADYQTTFFLVHPEFAIFARDALHSRPPIMCQYNNKPNPGAVSFLKRLVTEWSNHFAPMQIWWELVDSGLPVDKMLNVTFTSHDAAAAGEFLLSGNLEAFKKLLTLDSISDKEYALLIAIAAVSHRYLTVAQIFTEQEVNRVSEDLKRVAGDPEYIPGSSLVCRPRNIEYINDVYLPMLQTRQAQLAKILNELNRLFSDSQDECFYPNGSTRVVDQNLLESLTTFRHTYLASDACVYTFEPSVRNWAQSHLSSIASTQT